MLKDLARKAMKLFSQEDVPELYKAAKKHDGRYNGGIAPVRSRRGPHPGAWLKRAPTHLGYIYTGIKTGGLCLLPSGAKYRMQYNGWRRVRA